MFDPVSEVGIKDPMTNSIPGTPASRCFKKSPLELTIPCSPNAIGWYNSEDRVNNSLLGTI